MKPDPAARLKDLESHIAHLERQYDQLNEVVITQGRLLKKLQVQQQRLSDTVESAELDRIRANNPKPPHH